MDAKTVREGSLVNLAFEAISLIHRNNRSIKQIEKLIRDLYEFVDEPFKKTLRHTFTGGQMTDKQKREGNIFLLIGEALRLALDKVAKRKTEDIAKLIKALQEFKDAPSIHKKFTGSPIPLKKHVGLNWPTGDRPAIMPR